MESVRTPFEVEIRLAVPRPVRRHDRNDVCHRNTLGKPDRTANSGKNSYLYPPGLPRNTKYNTYRMMKPHKILWLGCCLAVAGCGGDKSSARNYDKEIDQLMDRMTLAEKIGQMNQVSGKSNPTGVLKQYSSIEGRVREGKIGTVLNVTGAAHYTGTSADRSRRDPAGHPPDLRAGCDPRLQDHFARTPRRELFVGHGDHRSLGPDGCRRSLGSGSAMDFRPDGRHRPRPALGPRHRGSGGGPLPRFAHRPGPCPGISGRRSFGSEHHPRLCKAFRGLRSL